jgi:hypothetical protein
VCGAHPRNRNVTGVIFLHIFFLKVPLIVCSLRLIPKIKSNIECFMKRRSFGEQILYYNSVNSPGVRSQIRAPLSRLNRRTDGAASQIRCLPVVKHSPGGVARCAPRVQHPVVVIGYVRSQSTSTLSLVTSDD